MVAELHIREEGGSRGYRVWPEPETIPPGAVQERRAYLFELRGAADARNADLFIDELPLEALLVREPEMARWRWKPGFNAGIVEARLAMPGAASRRFEITTDPDLRKLTRDEFDGMVREILADTFALFSLTSFRHGVARGPGGKTPPLARLEFLRSRVEEIAEAVDAIVRRPRRTLQAREESVPYHRAARATGPEILKSFRTGRVASEKRTPGKLPRALRGHLPDKIRQLCRQDSFDLREHREIRACLTHWAKWLAVAADRIEREGLSDKEERKGTTELWKRRCRSLSRRLFSLANLPIFREVGDNPPRLILSPVWRNDPAYRRFFRLYRDMNLGIAAITGDFLQMPLARTFDLYELWCFVRLLRASIEKFGGGNVELKELFRPDVNGGITIEAGAVVVCTGTGPDICFQKQFREFWNEADGLGSFSRTMKPDITLGDLASAEGRPLIVLDAKYRIDEGLNSALNSIHTYRDALVRDAGDGLVEGVVRAAYLLTPHLPTLNRDYGDTRLPGRLFHPAYRRKFRFGAVTLRPGMTVEELVGTLEVILRDAAVDEGAPGNG